MFEQTGQQWEQTQSEMAMLVPLFFMLRLFCREDARRLMLSASLLSGVFTVGASGCRTRNPAAPVQQSLLVVVRSSRRLRSASHHLLDMFAIDAANQVCQPFHR